MATVTHGASDDAIDAFAGTLRGSLLRPDDQGYEEARTVWNAMIDEHPALIVRCAGTADVIAEQGGNPPFRGGRKPTIVNDTLYDSRLTPASYINS